MKRNGRGLAVNMALGARRAKSDGSGVYLPPSLPRPAAVPEGWECPRCGSRTTIYMSTRGPQCWCCGDPRRFCRATLEV